MNAQISPCESVILYIWQLLIQEKSPPYLSGLREEAFGEALPPTSELKGIEWLPTLSVAGRRPQNLGELVCHYKWKKIQERIQWQLELWLKKPLPLKVLNKVITPFQMLEEQSQGRRVVTLPIDFSKGQEVVQGKKPLMFVLHDLEHAERFFHSEINYYGQVGFYHHLQQSVISGFWRIPLIQPDFQKSFFYLMSDMNTHCVHMLKYLRANLWNSFQGEAEGIWFSLVNQLIQGQELKNAFFAINTRQESALHLIEIEKYFVQCGRSISPQEIF